ncbi:MAG TPA: hypothetical protein VLQ76_02460, partial [Bacteroidales bacterium]|nr:hypothetical protein [Bacteroidales bacterium]
MTETVIILFLWLWGSKFKSNRYAVPDIDSLATLPFRQYEITLQNTLELVVPRLKTANPARSMI